MDASESPDQSTMIFSKMYQEEKDCSIRLSGDAGVILLGMVPFLRHQTVLIIFLCNKSQDNVFLRV